MIENYEKIKVGVLGATGMVGQRLIMLLKNHPWFEISVLAASEKSAGMSYEKAVSGRWKIKEDIPNELKNMEVLDVFDYETISNNVDFVFSAVAMPKEDVIKFEEEYARREIIVISNNSAQRNALDVPMIIPEINYKHAQVIDIQRKRLKTKRGFIAVKPNCSVQSYVPMIAAWEKYKPYEILVSTYQAISGSGKTLDEALEINDNIIPYIKGEEEKSEIEPLKILGEFDGEKIINKEDIKLSCQCIRVPVNYGHSASCFIKFKEKVTKEELINALEEYPNYPKKIGLPSACEKFIKYYFEDDRPQVTKDVNRDNGMGIAIGRLRTCNIFDYKFIGLSHNTIRGAAGGAILAAELYTKLGYISKK